MNTTPTSPLRTIPHSLRDLEDLLQIQMELLATQPGSFAYQLGLHSLELRREDILNQRTKWFKERGVERVELHFHSPALGPAPLRLIGGALAAFQSILDSLGRALEYGPLFAGFIPRTTTDRTGVGLVRLTSGSLGLVVEGPTQPTLYGESLLASSIENLFALLDAGADSTKLLDLVGEVGLRSLVHYADWTKMISDENAQIAVTWNYLKDTDRQWQASTDQLAKVYAAIGAIRELDKREEEVVGLIQGRSLSQNRFALVTEPEGKTVFGRVPIELQPVTKEFLGKRCKVRTVVQVVTHTPTEETRTNRTLIGLSSPS